MAAGLVQMTSCAKENFVNPVPTNVISDLTAFDSKDRVEGQVRAIYASIKNSGMYGGRYQIFNDIRGEDFMNERTNVVTGFDVWNYTPSNSSTNSVQNHWSRAYYVINLTNVFLEGMTAKGTAVVGTPEEILMNSPIAPPIVELARTLGLKEIGVSVREMRRMTQEFRDSHEVTQQETASISSKPCVNIKDLTISYSGKNAVNSLSATIYENEIVAIMGRNGAGKSSLLRAIAGVSDNAAGQVIVNGIDSQKLHSKQRRENVGYIPQEPSDLLYGQSVAEECKQADSDNQIETGTTFTLLSQLVPGISTHTHPRDLSEGQRLGLALSVVLSANPRLLILDEPTRGLDYQAKRVLTKLLIDFARVFNRSVIIATHDVELVAELATRTIFVADGDIVADGPTIDVLLSSPAFAPQVSKIMAPQPWLTVADVVRAIEADK